MRIFLEPSESLLFRTGRPFDAGESGYAESMFPPTPETLQGAIRATIATHLNITKTIDEVFRDDNLINLIGNRSSYDRDNYKREPRNGIEVQNTTKTTEEDMLYQMHMIRMRPGYGFLVDIRLSESSDSANLMDDTETQNKLHLPSKGWITLGGERRAARFEVIGSSIYEQESLGRQTGNLLYLATPTYFEAGWQPTTWPNSINPIAAAVDRYKPIGGWRLNPGQTGGTQKLVRRCVPAGSVYFFDKPITITQPLTEFGSHIGYGITYTGEW